MLRFDVETAIPMSVCCECGSSFDLASGPATPQPGDFTLCIRCGSLNVLDEELRLRAPTREEMLSAAANSELQRLRRTICEVQAQASKGEQ
ncbi:MAG: hypothetical protein ACM31O_03390 [Bacteroidota bacterium]